MPRAAQILATNLSAEVLCRRQTHSSNSESELPKAASQHLAELPQVVRQMESHCVAQPTSEELVMRPVLGGTEGNTQGLAVQEPTHHAFLW